VTTPTLMRQFARTFLLSIGRRTHIPGEWRVYFDPLMWWIIEQHEEV